MCVASEGRSRCRSLSLAHTRAEETQPGPWLRLDLYKVFTAAKNNKSSWRNFRSKIRELKEQQMLGFPEPHLRYQMLGFPERYLRYTHDCHLILSLASSSNIKLPHLQCGRNHPTRLLWRTRSVGPTRGIQPYINH